VNVDLGHDFERLSLDSARIFDTSHPRTVAFVGYSDNRLGLTDVSLTQTDRTLFVKLGYALRP